jgi:hypothetical protein
MSEEIKKLNQNDFNIHNSYLHLSGVFNILFPGASLLCATIYHFAFNERWPNIRSETRKVIDFWFIEFLFFLIVSFLPLTYFYEFSIIDTAPLILSSLFSVILHFGLRAFFILIYYKQFKRAKRGAMTNYPMAHLQLSSKFMNWIEKATDDKDEPTPESKEKF